MLGIAKLIAVILFTAHIIGCIFFMIANSLHWRGRREWADTHNLLRCSFAALDEVDAVVEGSSGGHGLAACGACALEHSGQPVYVQFVLGHVCDVHCGLW